MEGGLRAIHLPDSINRFLNKRGKVGSVKWRLKVRRTHTHGLMSATLIRTEEPRETTK